MTSFNNLFYNRSGPTGPASRLVPPPGRRPPLTFDARGNPIPDGGGRGTGAPMDDITDGGTGPMDLRTMLDRLRTGGTTAAPGGDMLRGGAPPDMTSMLRPGGSILGGMTDTRDRTPALDPNAGATPQTGDWRPPAAGGAMPSSWGTPSLANAQLVAAAKFGGYNSPAYQSLMQSVGGQDNLNHVFNQYSEQGNWGGDPALAQQIQQTMITDPSYGTPGPNPTTGGVPGNGPGPTGPLPPTPNGGPLQLTGTGIAPTSTDPGTGNVSPSTPANFPTFGANDQYKFTPSGQYNDPGYQFRMDEGMRNLMAQKAGLGSLGSGQTLRDIMNYGQSAASGEYSKAYDRFTNDRNFNYGVNRDDRDFGYRASQDDRNFGYTAATGDRNYNTQLAQIMASLGLQGAQSGASSGNTLAAILAGLMTSGGTTGAAGTIGGNNALTGGLQQIIQMLMANQYMQR